MPYQTLAPGQTPGLQPSLLSPLAQISAGEVFPAAGASPYLLLGPGMSPGLQPAFPPWMSTNYNFIPYVVQGLKIHQRFSVLRPSMTFTVEP